MGSQIGYFDTLKSVAGKVFTYLASITLTGTDGKTITCTQDTSLDEAVAMSSKAPKASPVFTGNVTLAGNVVNTTLPAFLILLASEQSNIAINTAVTVLFASEAFDQGSNFNTGTYTFTAPVTGKYHFDAYVQMNAVDTAAAYYELRLVTSNRNYTFYITPLYSADVTSVTIGGSVLADMDINDTAYVAITQIGGTQQTDLALGSAYFSGYLVA